mgnify:CR=1 FL=1
MTKTILYLFSILFLILITVMYSNINENSENKEGFNTYFRQTVRPHIRTFRNAHETITYHFNNKFNNFINSLGISY